MAVTKIRKISSWSLLIAVIVSLVVLAIFFLGGVENPGEELKRPLYTNLLLDWTYLLFGVTVLCALVFAVLQFFTSFKNNSKSALMSLGAVVVFVAMLLITYAAGDGEPLNLIGYEGVHNVPFWLKLTDMWLYSSYILIGLIILSVIVGGVKKVLNK